MRPALLIGSGNDAPVHIERMHVVVDRAPHPEIEEQIAERLVGFVQPADPLPLHDCLGIVVSAFGDQPEHLVLPVGENNSPDSRTGLPAVQRILVELNAFAPRVAENHGPQTSVTHGQSLLPHAGRRRVPQPVGLRGQRQSQQPQYRR